MAATDTGERTVMHGFDQQGTTAQRPASPGMGNLFYDLTLDQLIVYNGGEWAAVGGYIPDAVQQALSGAGALTVIEFYSAWTTTSTDAGTLADGILVGQLKKIQLIVDGGDGTLTPVNLVGGTTIVFADAGDYCLLRWTAAGWQAIELGNDADGATAPVLA